MSPQSPEGPSRRRRGGRGLPTVEAVKVFGIQKQIEQIQFHHSNLWNWPRGFKRAVVRNEPAMHAANVSDVKKLYILSHLH